MHTFNFMELRNESPFLRGMDFYRNFYLCKNYEKLALVERAGHIPGMEDFKLVEGKSSLTSLPHGA